MQRNSPWLLAIGILVASLVSAASAQSYLGFDRNDYPGDENLKALRQTFSFAGYWLNNPPGENRNSWIGKRPALQAAGFGFLVLFNGRLYADLKTVRRATSLGKSDGHAAVAAARREGFPLGSVIFLDQEQGGRMLPEQKAYIYNWVDEVNAGGFLAGIYCSGIAAQESPGVSIVTAEDIRENAGNRRIVYFVTNDACPPSPGCAFPRKPPSPAESGIVFADVWQFAQSPKRRDVAAACPANYNADGNCYPPGVAASKKLHVDVETANSPDPSQGANRRLK
ncbi:MAG TPA: glycoside hydrolase domain-containing protein [Terriglobales bacterium]|nr:glycoside hydrolase domain-containing protein [Terriglobales bacterium]